MTLHNDDSLRAEPPTGGAATAMARGRRLRRRRQALLTASGTAALSVAVVLASLVGGDPRRDSLQVADHPTPAPSTQALQQKSDGRPADVGSEPSTPPTPAAPSATPSAPAVPPQIGTSPRPTPPPSQPGVTRTYDGAAVNIGGTFCSQKVSAGGVQRSRLCFDGLAEPSNADSRHRVPISSRVCEDETETTSDTLHYRTGREVDYAVYRGTHLVWRWSAGRPAASTHAHTLPIDPGRCWTWATTWRAVDSKGSALHGDFVLVATGFAREAPGEGNSYTYDFSL